MLSGFMSHYFMQKIFIRATSEPETIVIPAEKQYEVTAFKLLNKDTIFHPTKTETFFLRYKPAEHLFFICMKDETMPEQLKYYNLSAVECFSLREVANPSKERDVGCD